MKVVLFCGGLGTRLRDYSDTIPKPLVNIGSRPILWHLMRYYAHFGHKDFILCLGYKGEMIRDFFLTYNECLSNDFTMRKGGREIELYNSDISEWNITFVETGSQTNIGQRLCRVARYLEGEEMFMANYSDGLSDLNLAAYLDFFYQRPGAVASFLSVRPSQSFHSAEVDSEGFITDIRRISGSDVWVNGGFMVFKREIFNYIREGEELVEEPFQRLIGERKLVSYRHHGFWVPMDTYKDKKHFDVMYEAENTPWAVWK